MSPGYLVYSVKLISFLPAYSVIELILYYFKNGTGFCTTNLMAQKSDHRLGGQDLNLRVEAKPHPTSLALPSSCMAIFFII